MAKVQIRRGVWETNSSSVHTLTMCSKSDFESWKNGDLVYDERTESLVSKNDVSEEEIFKSEEYSALLEEGKDDEAYNYRYDRRYFNYDSFFEYGTADYLCTYTEESTIDGVEVVAFGEYGHD